MAPLSNTLCAYCGEIPLLAPKGPIGSAELVDIGIAFALMLIVVVPVIVMALWFPRRYSASRGREDYDREWCHSLALDFFVWLIPSLIVIMLAALTWKETHRLDPFVPIAPGIKPVTIEAVSLDWKWLFIYPEERIATINQLVFPAHVPVKFRITSGTVVTSFFIPQLGSQIYAMAGMQTRLYLLADEPGTYFGQNEQFSGKGFSDMNFEVRVVPMRQFEEWMKGAAKSPLTLDPARYREIAKPGIYPVTAFSGVEPGLFEAIIASFHRP